MEALKVPLPLTSRFHTDPILWTQREEKCAQKFVTRILLAEQNHQHISSIFVGMKGTGKTTLIKKICIVAGALSDTLFVTYFDITGLELDPLSALNLSLELEGDSIQFGSMSEFLDYIRHDKKRKLFTVIDEAQKYYKDKNESTDAHNTSMVIIRQVYELGIARGSTCVLCGSSPKLVDLALERKITDTSKELHMQYSGYDSLNHQKFNPVVLPLLERQDLPAYLKFFNLSCDDKAATEQWIRTGGSLRYLANNSNPSVGIPLQGPASVILLWLYDQQPKTGVDALETVYLTKKKWSDNNTLKIQPALIYNLIDECLLSATFAEDGSVTAIGFAYPSQYLHLLHYNSEPHGLSVEQRIWLLKLNGKELEWLVEECVQKEPIKKKLVLCFGGKNSNFEGAHEDVFLQDWDPLGRHLDQVMKIYPDEYGVGTDEHGIETNLLTDMIKVSMNDDGLVQLYTAQMELGKDLMTTVDQFSGGLPLSLDQSEDSVSHMLQRFQSVSGIEKALKQKIGDRKLCVSHNAYITRKLSDAAKKLITDSGIALFDRQDMIKKVWSQAVLEYAQSVPIQWITEELV